MRLPGRSSRAWSIPVRSALLRSGGGRNRFVRATGFTLVEILLAMFIFAIVVTTIFGSYRTVASSFEALDEGMITYEMAATCMGRMVTDIESTFVAQAPLWRKPGIGDSDDPFRVVGEDVFGDASLPMLRFTSFAHVPQGGDTRQGIAEIVYYVTTEEAEDERFNVLRRADRLPPYPEEFSPDRGDPVLCERVKSFVLTYYDEEGETKEDWDSTEQSRKYATPRAVKVRLEIGDETTSHVFESLISFPVWRAAKE